MSARVKKTAQQIVGLTFPGWMHNVMPRGGYSEGSTYPPPSCPPGYKLVWARVNVPVPGGPPTPAMAWVCVPIGVAHKGF